MATSDNISVLIDGYDAIPQHPPVALVKFIKRRNAHSFRKHKLFLGL